MRKLNFLLAVALLTVAALGLRSVFAQTAKTWTAGPTTSGTANGVSLKLGSGDSVVAAPVSTTDGTTTKSATQFPSNGTGIRYLYFDVDSSGLPSAPFFARVDVEFLDESALAGSLMRVQYDSTSSAFAESDYVSILGSGRYQTATFHLSDVKFATSQNAGFSDFRVMDVNNKGIKVTSVTVTASTTTTRPTGATQVNFDAGANPSANGLEIRSAGDGVISFTSDFGRQAVKVSSAGNVYFNVDDTYMSNGSPTDAAIDVTYYDKGYGFFYIVFDARAGTCTGSGDFCDSFGPSTDYLANNVVYMQDSGSWKTYRFNISQARFNNRLLEQADFKIIQPHATSADTVANAGYDLRVSKVVVTRQTTPIDKTSEIEGNYAGFGSPAWVWTQLGNINLQGHGIYQDETSAGTTANTVGGLTGRSLASGSATFNVNDNYLKNGADRGGVPIKSVVIGVQYYDAGSGAFTVDYESNSGTKSAEPLIQLTGSNTWKRGSFYITDGKFNNGLTGGNDFTVKQTLGTGLTIRDVVLTRTVGEHRTGTINTGFSRTQKIAGVHSFPVFDGYRPSLWERAEMAPAGTGADAYTTNAAGQNVVNTSYSFRSIGTHTKELADMQSVGFDFALIWYNGNTVDANTQGVMAVRQMVAAAQAANSPIKFGLLMDPVNIKSDKFLRNNDPMDMSDPATYGQFIKLAEDFFSLVPRNMWATIDGRPIIAVYYQLETNIVSRQDTGVLQRIIDRMEATHGVRPYLIPDRLYDPSSTLNLPADDYFSWGAGECSSCVAGSGGYAQRSVFEIGPGFNLQIEGRTSVRDRESGAFYSRSWDRGNGKGNHMILVDTFNYWHEGAAIGESREFGRQYLDLTRTKIQDYKSRNFATSSTVSVTLGEPSTVSGLMQDEVPGALTSANTGGGRLASGTSMYFSVDDSFWESTAGDARITVEYLDRGVGIIDVKADGATGEVTAGRINVVNSNTGQFKTATFDLNAYFGNRLTFANDIRLDTDVAGTMVIKSVTVQRLGAAAPTPTPTPRPCTTDTTAGAGAVPTRAAGVNRSLLPLAYRNSCGS